MIQDCDSSPISKLNLIKELSLHFEAEHDLTPLASKIYSHLILSESESLTFDEIIKITGASKSSVSNQINYLLDESRIDFVCKENKRRRYFKTNDAYLSKTLESHYQKIQKEIAMLSKVIEHKTDQDFENEMVKIFKDHLLKEKENIHHTIQKLSKTKHTLKANEE